MIFEAVTRLKFETNSTLRLLIEGNGTLNVGGTANYENLVTADDDIPNKKYVDDKAVAEGAAAVATAGSNAEDYVNDNFYAPSGHTGNGPRVWVENFAPTLPTQGDDGDLWFEI